MIFDFSLYRSRRASLINVFIFAISLPIGAKVASIPLSDLIANSEVIVKARVVSVKPESTKADALQIATATVEEIWKGNPEKSVQFVASPTWTCDISEALPGESVILFLSPKEKTTVYSIGHSGRGRMPIRQVGGMEYVTLWDDIILPKGSITIPGPEPKYSFIRSFELSSLKKLLHIPVLATTSAPEVPALPQVERKKREIKLNCKMNMVTVPTILVICETDPDAQAFINDKKVDVKDGLAQRVITIERGGLFIVKARATDSQGNETRQTLSMRADFQ